MQPMLRHAVDNGDGWKLDIKQYRDAERHDPRLTPILIIPGYCMNTFILAYHPRGVSLVEYLCRQGYEVFTANLRGQGDSERLPHGTRKIGFRELALSDLPTALELTLEHTRRDQVHLIGCSLGGSIAYAYLAHRPTNHRLRTMVAMGAPLRWNRAHPVLKALFSSTRLASLVDLRGTRRLAKAALPLAQRIPKLLSIYMNTSQIDLTRADELVRTIDDPHVHLNIQLVHWVQSGDLIVGGKNVADALESIDLPLLNIYANADGIVPAEAARSIEAYLGSNDLRHLEVGDRNTWFAHADMFISDSAERQVFEPMARWLKEREV